MPRTTSFTACLATLLAVAACTTAPEPSGPAPATSPPPASAPASPASPSAGVRQVDGATVRFTAGSYSLDVTVGADTPAVREFLGMLPMQVPIAEFGGREKIGYLPRKLDTSGTPGSDPEDGDLIYFVPWGNLGFYYNADGIGYSEDTVHIGAYNATAEELERLENERVTIALVE